MKRSALVALLLVGVTAPALAADLPRKLTKAAPAPEVPSPFYGFVHGGAGFANVQSDITLPGVAVGSPQLWPAGFMVGGGFGVLTTIGPLSIGAEAEANYDFTRAGVGCGATTAILIGNNCLGSAKNSLFFAEKALVGITLSQLMGYIPTTAQPQNWPVPISVPASLPANFMLLGVVGAAQRNVDLCATDLATGNDMCGSQWKNGLLVGVQARFAVSQNVSVRVEWDDVMFNQSFTPLQSVPLFTNTIDAKNEQRLMAGFSYNF